MNDKDQEIKQLNTLIQDLQMVIRHYRQMIDSMQGEVFFQQDEDGFLCRWCPPRRSILDKTIDSE
jgi:hypothetical protein